MIKDPIFVGSLSRPNTISGLHFKGAIVFFFGVLYYFKLDVFLFLPAFKVN